MEIHSNSPKLYYGFKNQKGVIAFKMCLEIAPFWLSNNTESLDVANLMDGECFMT